MRVARSLLLLALAAAPLSAQDSRLTVGALVGHRGEGVLFSHAYRVADAQSGGTYRSDNRLASGAAPMLGARLEYALGPRWRVYAEGSHAGTDVHFREWDEFDPDGAGGPREFASEFTTSGSVTSVGLGVGRRFRTAGRGPAVEVTAGGAVDRYRLDGIGCPPSPPSIGGPPSGCLADPRLEKGYTVPSVIGGLGLRQRVGRRVEVHARAAYSYGRARTERMFVDLVPELDAFEAPTSRWFGVPRLSGGVTLRL